jgi:hypothetical protein
MEPAQKGKIDAEEMIKKGYHSTTLLKKCQEQFSEKMIFLGFFLCTDHAGPPKCIAGTCRAFWD